MLESITFALGTVTPAPGSSVINESIKLAMNTGIADLTATFNDVIGIVIPAAITLIAINAGINFALGKIRGLMGWAQ